MKTPARYALLFSVQLSWFVTLGCVDGHMERNTDLDDVGKVQAKTLAEPGRIRSEGPLDDEQLATLLANHSATPVTDLLLDGGGVSDAAMKMLANLKSLEHLRIRESRLTDAGLDALASTDSSLQILNLPQAKITAAGIASLARLPKLRQLRVGGRQIDDLAAARLAELPKLTSLHLIGPSLTAEGLDHLSQCPRLSSLYIDDCPLPDEAWQALFAAKPNLHVHIDQQHHDRDPNREEH